MEISKRAETWHVRLLRLGGNAQPTIAIVGQVLISHAVNYHINLQGIFL